MPEARPELPSERTPKSCVSPWFVSYHKQQPPTNQLGLALTQDNAGNTYVTGGDGPDLFAARLDVRCNIVWTFLSKPLSGSEGVSRGYAIAIDGKGDIVIAGVHGRNHQIGTQAYRLRGVGNRGDALVLKLSPSGKLLWSVSGGGGRTDIAYSLAIDPKDQIYIAGRYSDKPSFGPIKIAMTTDYEAFAAKLDDKGNWLWVSGALFAGETHKSGNHSFAYQLTLGPRGGAFVSGSFSHPVKLGTFTLKHSHHEDAFVAKLDDKGTWLWAKTLSGDRDQKPAGLVVDKAGALYLLCNFEQTWLLDRFQFRSTKGDLVLAKLDSAGKWSWAKSSNSPSPTRGSAMALSSTGQILVAGTFVNELRIGAHSTKAASTLTANPFVAAFDANQGGLLWATHADSRSALTEVHGLSVGPGGSVFVTGAFSTALSVGGTLYKTQKAEGITSLFIFKLDAKGGFQ